MRKKKNKFQYKKVLLFLPVPVVAMGFIWLNFQSLTATTTPIVAKENIKKVIYPKQYSDTNITRNAVNTDFRFKNVVVFDKYSLLSNVISSVVKDANSTPETGLENGTWLWTPLMMITPTYRDTIISGAKKNGIGTIYLSIDSYLDIFVMSDGPEKNKAKLAFDDALEDFIVDAHQNGIGVDAEGGWQNWAEYGNTYKAFALIDYVINFNKTHTEKLRGFQYDVESYLLTQYQNDKQMTLYNFVSLIDQTVAKLDNSDLKFSVVIPDFYDSESSETPKFPYRGNNAYTFDHLLSILDRRAGSQLIVMSYRNFSRGSDSSVDISKGEIKQADETNTKIIIAQETGDVLPPYITFNNTSRSYYNKQLSYIKNYFGSNKSFGGVATHYANAFFDLK